MADSTTEELEQRAELAEQAHVCAAEERDFLRGRVAELEAKLQQQALENLTLHGQLEEALRDATRYRWLRSKNVGDGYQQGLAAGCLCTANGEEMDAAIDTAIAKDKP